MIKKLKLDKFEILTLILCLVPIIIGIILYTKLPDQIAIHFDTNNQPDSYASKFFVILGMPIILTLLQLICCITSKLRSSIKVGFTKLYYIVRLIIPIISNFAQAIIYSYALTI